MSAFKRAALYARFSSDLQRTESIDAQVRAMKKYCIDNNLQIVRIYSDEAISGRSVTKRTGFLEMIDDSEKNLFDIVVVHKLDRFARNRYDSAIYKARLRKNGVEVYSVLEQLNGSPESIMLEALLEGMNEYYSRNLAREVMKGMKENAYQCKHTGGPPPLGYYIDDDGHLAICEHEAEAVRIIFDLYNKGYGYSYIIDTLNERGYKTRNGNDFRKNSLYQIITNEKYYGMYVYNKVASANKRGRRNNHQLKNEDEIIRIPGGCPAIISKETFDNAKKRIDMNRLYGNGRYNAKHCYLLSGIVECGVCHHKMCGNFRSCGRAKTLFASYRCQTKKYDCHNREINKEYLDQYVVDILEEHIFNKRAMKKIVERLNSFIDEFNSSKAEKIRKINLQIAEKTEGITNLTQLVEQGTITSAVVDRINELEEEKNQLILEAEKLDAMEKVSDAKYQRLVEEYDDVPKNTIEYREFIRPYIVRVEVRQFDVAIVLRTGLGVMDELDTTITVRRQEIYEAFGSSVRKIS